MLLHKSYVAEESTRSKPTYMSYNTQQQLTEVPVASRVTQKTSRSTKQQLADEHQSASSRNKLMAPSPAPATKPSDKDTVRTGARRGNVKDDRPILSRSTSSPLTARLDSFSPSRLPHPMTVSLASSRLPIPSSSASDHSLGLDSTRKVLRRKAPSVEQYVSSLAESELYNKRRTDLKGDRIEKRSSKSLPGDFRESNTTAFLGAGPSDLILPTMLSKRQSGELPPALIPELKALAAATTLNRTATSTPHMPAVGSPSTQHSGSTGPWSSRDTTPTSISSCSPGIVQPSRAKTTSARLRKAAPPHAKAEGLKYGFKTPPPMSEIASSSRAPYASKSYDYEHTLLQQHRNNQTRKPLLPSAPAPPTAKSPANAKSSHQAEMVSGRSLEGQASEQNVGLIRMGEPCEETLSDAATGFEGSQLRNVPPRPSRKGTADLDGRPSPVVQSNLSPQSLRGYRQRDSVDVAMLDYPVHNMISGRGEDIDSRREAFAPVVHVRRRSLRDHIDPASTSSRLPVTGRDRDTEPAGRIFPSKESSSQGSRDAERSTIAKLSSRLGLFGRRSKSSREATNVQETRDLRKGPAAGTGHEGYGKYARRGRKHSAGNGDSSRDRSTSTTSRPSLRRKNSMSSTGGSGIDDFVAQRLQPMVISGGGGHNVRPDSDAPTVWPSFDGVSIDSSSSLDLARQLTSEKSVSLPSYSRSMSVTSVATDAPSTLALDTRARTFSAAIQSQSYPAHAPPSSDGYNTSRSSLIQDDVSVISAEHTLNRPTMRDLKKASKGGRMFKWNVFRRKPSVEQSASTVPGRDAQNVRMSVAVASTSFDKPIPYYALMDSENENMVDDDLQDLLEQTRRSPPLVAKPDPEPQGLGLRREYGQSVLLPSMPNLQRKDSRHAQPSFSHGGEAYEVQPSVALPHSAPAQSSDKNRRRLPQVGRIPRVISRRDRQHKPAATSFSRPFQRDNVVDVSKATDDYAAFTITDNKRPILGIQTDVLPSRPFFTPESGQAASAPGGPLNTCALGDFDSHPGFLVFPGKDNYGNFAANSSDKVLSSAKSPARTAHRHRTEEDEVWNEYDDFLDQVMSPTSSNPALPSLGPSSSQLFADAIQPQREHARPESPLGLGALQRRTGYDAYLLETPSLHLPPPPLQEVHADYRLRRSRIVSALQSHSSMSPSSPFFSNDGASGGADQEIGSKDYGVPFGGSNVLQPDLLSPSTAPYLTFPKVPEVSRHQSTALLDIAERDHEGPVGQSDLRFAALMTSRWLSFGRVLFSPAHDLVKANTGQQILVIDGLGNDDWSFYCAVTYPGAVVHGLKETDISPGSPGERPMEAWRTPPNYRRVELPNLAEHFPFPRSYFAAIVFRFPAAMSDAVLKMALSECKRVLVPGGHLELSLMDLDITNMGTITRHAVRNLKARMISTDSNVSLKPVGDNIQNILGQRGFENLNRCVVGVPVAGKVATSSGSRSSRSSRESTSRGSRDADRSSNLFESKSHGNPESDRSQQRGGNFSLSELVSDHSATSDAKITKMVAKVGRWWYTRTYEWAVLPGGELKRSIWSDKKMLHECKVRGSSFKLLIAYAQKPVEMRRRTLSEPVRTTAAVAGTRMMERLEKRLD